MKLHELQEKRASAVAEMRALVNAAETAGRDLADNERSRFDVLKSEVASLDERVARAAALADMERRADAAPVAGGGHGGAPDLTRYSLARAIRAMDGGRLDGLEGECHAELARGRETRGLMIPTQVLLGEARSQTVANAPSGGYAVANNITSIADRFRPALKVESMGATVLRNLTGNLDMPNLVSSGTSYWVAEDTNTTRSSASFDNVSMSPRTVSGEYQMSRRLMIQANESIDALLRRDLGQLLAGALDKAAIKSSGAPNEPTGILSTAGVEKVSTESLFPDTTANLIAGLETDDITGSRAFLTNPTVGAVVRKLKDLENRPLGEAVAFHNERVEYSTQVPANIGVSNNKSALIYGQWSELVIGYWSGVDVLSNPYHSDVASKGGMLLHAFLDCDVAVRHAQAFAYAEI